jgi:hypothetical protein
MTNKNHNWITLRKYLDDQIGFFMKKFMEIGWEQEDAAYIFKRTPFIVNPDAKNEDYKHGFGISFYPELLEYREDGEEVLCPWVVGDIEIENPSDETLRSVADFIKEEVQKIGWNMFHDEDAFRGHFAKDKKHSWTKLKFYLNQSYPEGYWQNHTL